MFSNDKNNKIQKESKNIIFKIFYFFFVIISFYSFFYSINKTSSTNKIYNNDTFNNVAVSSNIYSFESPISTDPFEEELKSFITSAFNIRNDGFLNGDVSKLYNYYGTSEVNGKYSLDYEFKRISYLRDWAIERAIIFTAIDSFVIINSVTKNDNKIIIDLDEHYTFKYIYNKQFAVNKFTLTIPHILTIYNSDNNSFYIDKDYYCDIFNDNLSRYTFTLSETLLPYTKRLNTNYKVSNIYSEKDIIRFDKSFFTDHKAIICGYDSNGYPLINSNLFNISNMPFDLGWKKENIKLSYWK